jgi:hypothetical protein
MPMILEKLFDNNQDPLILNGDDSIVPLSSRRILRPPSLDCLITNSLKTEQENIFSISETIMKEKLKILLEKKACHGCV